MTKISALTAATTLTRSDEVPVVNGGATKRATVQQMEGSLRPWEFWVDDPTYGAVGDGSTDDTAAINAAVDAATTYALAHNGYAAVRFSDKTYLCSAALRTDQQGNAQIPLPVITASQQAVTLAFLGAQPYAAPNPYFHQTGNVAGAGTIIKSSLTAQTFSGTHGAPSVIGGPTPEQGWGYNTGGFPVNQFDNLTVVIDGITVLTEFESGAGTMAGVHLPGVAKAHIQSLACLADATLAQYRVSSNKPVNSWSVGLYMPQDQNADNCYIGSYTCYGFYTALLATEHTTAQRVLAVYCYRGIFVHAVAWHGVSILNASVEACQFAVGTDSSSGGPLRALNIGMLDCESMGFFNGDSGTHIYDPSNLLGGIINIVEPGGGGSDGGTINLTGAGNIHVTNLLTRTV